MDETFACSLFVAVPHETLGRFPFGHLYLGRGGEESVRGGFPVTMKIVLRPRQEAASTGQHRTQIVDGGGQR